MFKNKPRMMNEAGADPAPGGAPAPAAPAAPPAAAAPAEGSLLQTGAAAPAEFIPEKYRITKEDGTLDMEGSSRKLADAYGQLEKRLGSGDAPPRAAADYTVVVPDAFKEVIDPATDTGVQGFLTGAHAAGMTQAQVDYVMGQYFTMAPQLVAGAAHLDAAGATTELKKVWANDADFSQNVKHAYAGANAAAQKAGMDINEVMNGPLGNNPQFVRLMAAIGTEFKEDRPPGGATMGGAEDITKLQTSEAYTNPKHPEHATVSAKVRDYYQRKYGSAQV